MEPVHHYQHRHAPYLAYQATSSIHIRNSMHRDDSYLVRHHQHRDASCIACKNNPESTSYTTGQSRPTNASYITAKGNPASISCTAYMCKDHTKSTSYTASYTSTDMGKHCIKSTTYTAFYTSIYMGKCCIKITSIYASKPCRKTIKSHLTMDDLYRMFASKKQPHQKIITTYFKPLGIDQRKRVPATKMNAPSQLSPTLQTRQMAMRQANDYRMLRFAGPDAEKISFRFAPDNNSEKTLGKTAEKPEWHRDAAPPTWTPIDRRHRPNHTKSMAPYGHSLGSLYR